MSIIIKHFIFITPLVLIDTPPLPRYLNQITTTCEKYTLLEKTYLKSIINILIKICEEKLRYSMFIYNNRDVKTMHITIIFVLYFTHYKI